VSPLSHRADLGGRQQIIVGFQDIIQTAVADYQAMQNNPQYEAGPDSDSIFNAFRDFVRVHQQLLNILIGKAGLFQTVPLVGAPVAAVLRSLEGIVDVCDLDVLGKSVSVSDHFSQSVAFSLIDTVQSRSGDIQAQASSLDASITNAIKAYEGLSL